MLPSGVTWWKHTLFAPAIKMLLQLSLVKQLDLRENKCKIYIDKTFSSPSLLHPKKWGLPCKRCWKTKYIILRKPSIQKYIDQFIIFIIIYWILQPDLSLWSLPPCLCLVPPRISWSHCSRFLGFLLITKYSYKITFICAVVNLSDVDLQENVFPCFIEVHYIFYMQFSASDSNFYCRNIYNLLTFISIASQFKLRTIKTQNK